MGKIKDMTGKTVGMLTVISRAKSPPGRAVWLCRCACGKTARIAGKEIRNGHVKSCGCRKYIGPLVVDITGQKYGRLTAVKRVAKASGHRISWMCICDCGARLVVSSNALRRGNTKSCGCLKNEVVGAIHRTHGASKTPEYASWCSMKDRCDNPNNDDYALYGGRGISVCNRWHNSFENFYADMGPRPFPRASVDRKDVNGNYEPNNCRWATQKQQTRNKRNNRLLTFGGKTKTLVEWAEELGITQGALFSRLRRGWNPSDALTATKSQRWNRRKKRTPSTA